MPAERERFERAIAFATRAYPIREDNIFVVDGLPRLIRRAAIDIGRRLTKARRPRHPGGRRVSRDQELRAALAGQQADYGGQVRRRKAERVGACPSRSRQLWE